MNLATHERHLREQRAFHDAHLDAAPCSRCGDLEQQIEVVRTLREAVLLLEHARFVIPSDAAHRDYLLLRTSA